MPDKTISQKELICATATPSGRGALAIVRLSGKGACNVAQKITHTKLFARKAKHTSFYTVEKTIIDQGVAIYFQTPASFTGEDVVEFHCHGNPLVTDALLKTLCAYGARLATPGEFSLRAFLNNKIDLTQAEAIADLICTTTEQGIRTAAKSMQGEFSKRIQQALTKLIQIRTHIEAHLDFPDEEIDRQQIESIQLQLKQLHDSLKTLLQQAKLGERLQSGATIAIAGKPNAGKSSLLNVLAQSDIAIVTEIPGTTRDSLSADIEIQGVPVRLTDTAGLRETQDVVETKGIERAQQVLSEADIILWLTDVSDRDSQNIPKAIDSGKVIHVHNKIDLQSPNTTIESHIDDCNVYISAKTHAGIETLIQCIADRLIGTNHLQEQSETPFMARSRHVVALQSAQENIHIAQQRLATTQELELAAEDLRQAQQLLGEITGEFTSDDLLGRIFSEFCIGK